MTGLIRSNGIRVCEQKVGESLKRLDSEAQRRREETAGRSLNPRCYSAEYFGHKVHIDQNEKLIMFGVTHVMARDGYSGMIVATSTMPIKNNVIIYEEIYRHFTMNYGLWDQVRVDGGKEFVLTCHVQKTLRDQRRNTSIEPFRSTKSTENNIIERMWVEVNSRVNYPLKSALNEFVRQERIDLTNEDTKFAVSWVTCRVSEIGLNHFVRAWNHHNVPGKGIPIYLMSSNNRAVSVQNLMTSSEAVRHYETVTRRRLTIWNSFGIDKLADYSELRIRRAAEILKKCSYEEIFSDVQKGKNDSFLYCIQLFINVTNSLLCNQN